MSQAIAATWGARCDGLFFVIDDEVSAPDTLLNATILKLRFEHAQSTKDRNIWEKVWRMWAHVGRHHLAHFDFFFKVHSLKNECFSFEKRVFSRLRLTMIRFFRR